MRKLKPFVEADRARFERFNNEAWINGLYTCNALNTVLGNMFGGKGHQKQEYMKKPIDFKHKEDENREYTEEEIQKGREALLLKLQMMQCNFEHSKK